MNYLVKLHFQLFSDQSDKTEFEQQLRYVEALNEQEAIQKGIRLGKEEEELISLKHTQVEWKFIGITDVFRIDDLRSGQMIYAGSEVQESAEIYLYTISERNKLLSNMIIE